MSDSKKSSSRKPTLKMNAYMPDEISDYLMLHAKMLPHHTRYASVAAKKLLAKVKSKVRLRNNSSDKASMFGGIESKTKTKVISFHPAYPEGVCGALPHFYLKKSDAEKWSENVETYSVTLNRVLIFDKDSDPSHVTYSDIFAAGFDAILLSAENVYIVKDKSLARKISDKLTRNSPFLPSELKNIAVTHAKMLPHHFRYLKGALSR